MKKLKTLLMKFISCVVFLSGFWAMHSGGYSTFAITIGTLLFVGGFAIYIMSNPKSYNSSVGSVRMFDNFSKVTIQELYEAFKNSDTLFGKPWLGKVMTIKNMCLIFGPTEGGSFLYVHKALGNLYLSSNEASGWIEGPESELWRLEKPAEKHDIFDDEQAICYSLMGQTYIDDVYKVLQEYINTKVVTSFPIPAQKGKLYRFDEDFKLTGQKFRLLDFKSGDPMYEINSTMPLKTFHMTDCKTNDEVFRMTKRLINITSTYDFYLRGEKFGRFKQKIDIMHDTFKMKTSDGELEMKNITDILGTNYIVKLNDEVIGTIAERFTLSLHNLVFDNFILHIRNERYEPLMAALAVMAARELRRDRGI